MGRKDLFGIREVTELTPIDFFMNNSRASLSFLYPTHHPTRLGSTGAKGDRTARPVPELGLNPGPLDSEARSLTIGPPELPASLQGALYSGRRNEPDFPVP